RPARRLLVYRPRPGERISAQPVRGHLSKQQRWIPTRKGDSPLTALQLERYLFQTGTVSSPASRFLCEHLHQNLFWACISRIHAQVPVVTTGQLAKTFRQQISSGIDIAVVARPASRARPLPLIQPQCIEGVLAFRATLAR